MNQNEDFKDYFNSLANILNNQRVACGVFFNELKSSDNTLFKKLIKEIATNKNEEDKLDQNPQGFFSFDDKTFEKFKENNLKKHLTTDDQKLLFDKGFNFFSEQDYKKAFTLFNFLSVVNPTSASVILMKGIADQNLGKYTDAIVSYSQVLELDPTCLLAYVQLMESLLLSNHPVQAKDVYDTFIDEVDESLYSKDKMLLDKLEKIKLQIKS